MRRGRGWKAHEIVVRERDVVDLFDRILWHQDEPFGGVAGVADALLAERARAEGIIVLLEGQGADETLAGYEYYYRYHLRDVRAADRAAAERLYEEFRALRPGTGLPESLDAWLGLDAAVPLNLGQDGSIVTREAAVHADIRARSGCGFAEPETGRSSLDDALHRDLVATKVPRVLRFKDKASMMHGVELRVPFLDHRVVEQSFAIPADRKIRGGYTKACLRDWMADRLPREISHHVKRQVQTPQREWLRGALRPWVEDVLRSDTFARRGFVDIEAARRLYADYIERPDAYPNSFFVWQWISLERWARLFLDRPQEPARFPGAAPNHRRMPRPAHA